LFFRRTTTKTQEDTGTSKEIKTHPQEQAVVGTISSHGVGGAASSHQQHHTAAAEAAAEAKQPQTTTDNTLSLISVVTPNEKLVENFIRTVNAGDTCGLSQWVTNDADWYFQEAHMTLPGFLAEMQKIFDSFLDFHLHVHAIKEQPDGSVVVRLHASGTHTGAPFAFGPYPEIAPSGMHVVMDMEYVLHHQSIGQGVFATNKSF
jgi:hypothetical protein